MQHIKTLYGYEGIFRLKRLRYALKLYASDTRINTMHPSKACSLEKFWLKNRMSDTGSKKHMLRKSKMSDSEAWGKRFSCFLHVSFTIY